jgi:signal transduction histidine kinase
MKTHMHVQGGVFPVLPGVSRSRYPSDSVVVTVREAPAPPTADYEDRLHAIRAGLAGVAGALHVLTDERAELPDASRGRMESLLVAEVERLQRMAAAPAAEPPSGDTAERLDLDAIMADLVLARRLAGQVVHWQPSGHHVVARRDDLVEVLNILLVNAARHATGSSVTVSAVEGGAGVSISVSDDGPGVSPSMRHAIFERGSRHRDSPGQGLGLAIARELMHDLGGRLSLADRSEGGARFDLLVPSLVMDGAA